MKKMRYWGIMVGLILLLTACNLPSAAGQLSVEEMVATYQQQTSVAAGAVDDTEEAASTTTVTLAPNDMATLTVTLTPTQERPMVSVSVDTNCRTGPGKIYDWIGALLIGEEAEVVGRSMDGQYWVIKNPDRAGECWLWGNYASVTGTTTELPQYTPPPTPTPAFNWEGSWTTYNVDTGGSWTFTYPMTATVDGKDFTAVVDLGGGNYVNMTGTISNDNLSVSGTWTSPGLNGPFEIFVLGVNQFQGNGDNGTEVFGWCGGRSGAGQPSPCYKG